MMKNNRQTNHYKLYNRFLQEEKELKPMKIIVYIYKAQEIKK